MYQPSNLPLLWFALASAIATLFGAGAYYSTNEYWRLALGSLALIVGFVGLLILTDWMARAWQWHQWEANRRAAQTPAVVFANALRPLNPAQLALVQKYQTIEIQGRISKDGVLWSFMGLRGRNIPVDWAAWYLELAQPSAPELYPARGKEGDAFWSWEDTEHARAFAEILVAAGLALPAAGRRAAVLKQPLEDTAELLGLQLK